MALAMLTSFFPLATGCFNGLASKDGDFKDGAAFSLLALFGLSSDTSTTDTTDGNDPASDPDPVTTTTGGIPVSYRPGTNFYISFKNGSTDLVTDQNGHVTARFAYEPFGRLNPHASDLDVDGDHHSYTGGFLYTGQEYELETDTYDFHARTYDAQTGRFLQTDPIAETDTGYDSFDPYQYVYNDPVNKSDPDGRRVCLGHALGFASLAEGTISGGVFFGTSLLAVFGVAGNWTGGGGACSKKQPAEHYALMAVLYPFIPGNDEGDKLLKTYLGVMYYRNHNLRGHGPSFLGKLRGDDLKYFILAYHNYLQNDGDLNNDFLALFSYIEMTDRVSQPTDGVDEASPLAAPRSPRLTLTPGRVCFSHPLPKSEVEYVGGAHQGQGVLHVDVCGIAAKKKMFWNTVANVSGKNPARRGAGLWYGLRGS